MQDYYGLETHTHQLLRQLRADAERERMVRLVVKRRRALRARLAGALRGLAARLDGEPASARGRRPAPAR